jgi:hypothetical protein
VVLNNDSGASRIVDDFLVEEHRVPGDRLQTFDLCRDGRAYRCWSESFGKLR